MTDKREIVLGVGAGAACFKAVAVASLFTQHGYSVRTVMTPDAHSFVTPLSFVAVTGNSTVDSSTSVDDDGMASHLKPAAAAAFVVAPATADLIARLAHGFAGDAVSLAALSAPELKFFCPAMNDRMWSNPAVQSNVARLEELGWRRIGPTFGRLAEGYEGEGRMTEPEEIFEKIAGELE